MSQVEKDPVPIKLFQVIDNTIEAFELVRRNVGVFARVAIGWIVLIMIVRFASIVGLGWALGADADFAAMFSSLSPHMQQLSLMVPPLLVDLLGGVAVAVAWHRFAIMGEVPRGPLPFHGGRIALYIGRLLLTFGILMIFGFLLLPVTAGISSAIARMHPAFEFVFALVPLGTVALTLYVMVRTGLALPAAAIADKKWTIERSWHETDGNGLRLLGGVFLVWLPFYLANSGLSLIIAEQGASADQFLFFVIATLTSIVMMVGVAALSGFYSLAFTFFSGTGTKNSAQAAHFD